MRWSSMVKVGLSGTSLALAVGCTQPSIEEEPEPEVVATAQASDEEAEQAAAEEARRADRERRTRLAALEEQERARASNPGETPWFLRPAGEVTPASTEKANGEGDKPLVNTPPPPPKPVVAQPTPPKPVVAQPGQPINNQKPWGWQRAACGRG